MEPMVRVVPTEHGSEVTDSRRESMPGTKKKLGQIYLGFLNRPTPRRTSKVLIPGLKSPSPALEMCR